MARIDYRDGAYVGIGTYDERLIWQRAGFKINHESRPKVWTAPNLMIALQVQGVSWTTTAIEAANLQQELDDHSIDMSYKDATSFNPPLSEAVKARGWDFKPFQKAGIEFSVEPTRKDILIGDQPGLGKGQPLDAPVLTPTGWTCIGDLKVDDEVLHPRHGVQKVVGVYDRGVLPTYRVAFSDGSSTLCSEDHLWTFRRPQQRTRGGDAVHPLWETLELRQIAARFANYATLRSAKLRIPLTEPLELEEKAHVIAPYVMGALLGDGSFRGNSITLSSDDEDLLRFVRQTLPDELTLKYVGQGYDYVISGVRAGAPNPWITELRRLSLWGKLGDDKVIPKEYLSDSASNRRNLLQGLLDTDGYVAKDGTIQFSSNSRALVDGVRYLVQSLGGVARLSSKISASGKQHWITTLNLPPDVVPFRILRKVQRHWPKSKYPPCRIIDRIERVEDQFIRCIKVSAADGLYITDDCIVTHNTIQAIGVANCMGVVTADPVVERILVVVPASLKENWRREFLLWQTHTSRTVGIAEASYDEKVPNGVVKSGPNKGKTKYRTVTHTNVWPDTDVVIINYDILERFTNEIKSIEWDMLICDECHALKSADSKRTLFVLGGIQKPDRKKGRPKPIWWAAVEARKRIFLSGTPMLNRPVEFWPIVKAFDPHGIGRDFEQYAYRYCGAYRTHHGLDTAGATNLEELGEKIRAKFMVRRLKKVVLPELPPKTRHVIPLDSKEIREVVAREDELAQSLRLFEQMVAGNTGLDAMNEALQGSQANERLHGLNFADAMGDGEDIQPNWRRLNMDYASAVLGLDPPAVAVAFEEIALVRRELGMAKLSAVIPWCKDFIDSDLKLVLFAYHSDVVEALIQGLAKYEPAYIYGKVPQRARQGMVDRFQLDEKCRVIIGNIHAMGVGHTLTRASDVAFAEGDWTPALMEQCEDRVLRIGQEADNVGSFSLVANGSLDARIAQSAKAKQDNIEKVIG